MSGARDQVARLLALTPYLQKRSEGVPLSQVAADFGVTPRVIMRDLRVLFMCGLPGLGPGDMVDVDFEAIEDDSDGVVRISNADFLSRPFRLGSSEASALIVALRTLRESSSGQSKELVDRVLIKLEEAAAGGGVPVLAADEIEDNINEAAEKVLRDAIAADRAVLMSYHVPTRDQNTERRVDPLSIFDRDGHRYLDAWCHLAAGRRLFRLDRILHAAATDEPRSAENLTPRNLAADLFDYHDDDTVATISLSRSSRWFTDYYPVIDHREDGAGGLIVRLAVSDPRWLIRTALRLAPGLSVHEPPQLVRQLEDARRNLLAHYGQGVD